MFFTPCWFKHRHDVKLTRKKAWLSRHFCWEHVLEQVKGIILACIHTIIFNVFDMFTCAQRCMILHLGACYAHQHVCTCGAVKHCNVKPCTCRSAAYCMGAELWYTDDQQWLRHDFGANSRDYTIHLVSTTVISLQTWFQSILKCRGLGITAEESAPNRFVMASLLKQNKNHQSSFHRAHKHMISKFTIHML